jgi:hypothetical protein
MWFTDSVHLYQTPAAPNGKHFYDPEDHCHQTNKRRSVTTSVLRQLVGRTEKLPRLPKSSRSGWSSRSRSAQLTSVVEVDYSAFTATPQRTKEGFLRRHGVKLSFLPFGERSPGPDGIALEFYAPPG